MTSTNNIFKLGFDFNKKDFLINQLKILLLNINKYYTETSCNPKVKY